ncbi:helix-turn-helix domain-containing protein [Patescibacteria group bacterium]
MVKEIELKLPTVDYDEPNDRYEARRRIIFIAAKIGDISSEIQVKLFEIYDETGEIPKSLAIKLKVRLREKEPITEEEKGMIAFIKLTMGRRDMKHGGMSMASTATEIGITPPTLTKFINYKTKPKQGTLNKIKDWIAKHKHNTYNYLYFMGGWRIETVRKFMTEEEYWILPKTIYKGETWYG